MKATTTGFPASNSVAEFAQRNAAYYERAFATIQASAGFTWSFNGAAAACGPLWAAARGAWKYFCVAAMAELLALIGIGQSVLGEQGAESSARAAHLREVAAERAADAAAALQAGDTSTAATFQQIAANLERAAAAAVDAHGAAHGTSSLIAAIVLLVATKLAEGVFANVTYERQYTAWRADKGVPSGWSTASALLGAALVLVAYPLTVFRFAATHVPDLLTRVPVDRRLFPLVAHGLDHLFDAAYRVGGRGFDGMRDAIRLVVGVLETVLVGTPWPVVMVLLLVLAWRVAGRRISLLTAGAIAYLALLGLWEPAMQTVALLGTAAAICVVIGIPLGIWFSRSERAYAVARPVLDLMQTMPALVYLIPAIAFFGTGTPPGIVATLIFGLPPVVRLTTLGLRQVPEEIKEAGRAFGASKWQLLVGVELPLARPAIMTGVNQTILMCLSMVVIASLIGAQGLGSVVLEALQYAATGQGLLAGIAILLCAVVIDRLVQGSFEARE